ncbi:MAG: nucleotide disphospho-sugar-binding domain-containing protein [Leifsonia sp.]
MPSVILCSIPLDGHVAPMLGVARGLVAHGYRVRFLTGARFAAAVRATGAEYLPLPAESDHLDDAAIAAGRERNGERLTGNAALAANIKRLFLDPAAGQFRALVDAVGAEPTDAVLCESVFVGAGALARRPRSERPAVIVCGILPLGLSSRDTAPFGIGLAPRSDLAGRIRNRTLNWVVENVVMRSAQKQADATMRELSGRPLDGYFQDWSLLADHIAQFTVEEFEYPRSDAPAELSFLGPVARVAPIEAVLPDWWDELDGSRPVVHVSQGTVANLDFEELVLPTVRGLAGEDVTVVVATGGRPVSELGGLPSNVLAAEMLPYDRLMPLVDVFVSNGGYGGLHYALEYGVPIVAAGDTEDKVETTARVAWSGAGVNLRTGTPTADAVAGGVLAVLAEPSYRKAAERLAAAIAVSPGVNGLVPIIERLVAAPAAVDARG